MFENIGKKIKGSAIVFLWIGAITVLILWLNTTRTIDIESLLGAICCIFAVVISSWCLYGFGEIIDKLGDIEKNTRAASKQATEPTKNNKVQAKNDYSERKNQLEQLRVQGLITEEEYQQAISRKAVKDETL